MINDLNKLVAEYALEKIPMKLLDWISLEKLYWTGLSQNPAAMDLLEAKKDKIDRSHLSQNQSPRAIQILKDNPHIIVWRWLSMNPSAIDLLEAKITYIGTSYQRIQTL